ncbi:MAG: GDYXXLXY domain-containing protein [Planctomycetota bacterium]|jgi:uncharacterized membrane-anchored protein|nr:GDYXXLXY domain-containing protein [Planctomycetota bacterium]
MPEVVDQKGGMTKWALTASLVFVLAQAVFFIGWIWIERNPPGAAIRVATAPVDPRDIFRGQYLELSYRFDDPGFYPDDESAPNLMPGGGQTVFAALALAQASGLHEPLAYAPTLEEAREIARARGVSDFVVIEGRVGRSGFDFGVNRYFVPEGTPEPPRDRTVVLLLVPERNLRPRLRGLEVDGVLWTPERLEARE